MSTPPTLPPALAERFTVVQAFTGGEGQTCRARERQSGQELVVKVLPPGVVPAEAALLSSLQHPAIPRVLEVGELDDGSVFLVREYAAGTPLSELLPLAVEPALRLTRELLEVLAYVHLRGLLHLDLKPQNLLLADDGSVRLLDFGLGARRGDGSQGGTPFYAAPEVLLGSAPDARSDLFGLGAVLVAALWPGPGPLPLQRFLRCFPAQDFWEALQLEPNVFGSPFAQLLPRLLERRPAQRFVDAQAAMEFLGGGGGRPVLDLLRLDPVTTYASQLQAVARHSGDVLLLGGSDAERRQLALQLWCTQSGARALRPTSEGLLLQRDGAPTITLRLPPLTAEQLLPHLGEALSLHGEAARQAASWLLQQSDRSASALGELLVGLAEQGAIVPNGSGWIWPDAVAGRLDAAQAEPAPPTAENIALAARSGRVEQAFALYRAGSRDTSGEPALRQALAQGLLEAGEPARALPLCSDLPALRVQALFETGRTADAAAALPAAVAAMEGDELGAQRLQCTAARLDSVRGDTAAALQRMRALVAKAPSPLPLHTLALVLETAGAAEESRDLLLALLQEQLPPFLRAAALTSLGLAERRLGRLEPSRALFADARDLLFALGHARHAATATHNLGVVEKDLGQYGAAIEHLRQARTLFTHVKDETGAAIAEATLGIAALEAGDPVAAVRPLAAGLAELRRLGSQGPAHLAAVMLARAQAEQGDLQAAARTLQEVDVQASPRVAQEAQRVRAMLDPAPVATPAGPTPVPPSEPPTVHVDTQTLSRELFRTFLAVNRRLASECDLDKAMTHLLEAAVTLTGGRHGFLLVQRQDGLRREVESGDPGPAGQAFSRSLANRAMQQRRTLTSEDALADRELQEMPSIRNLTIRSAICAPFQSATGASGAIYVEHPGRSGAFGDADKDSLEVLADQAAIAVDRMLREEELARDLDRSRRELAVVQRQVRREPVHLIGESPQLRDLKSQINKLAQLDLSVLILGETGTGKELVARAMHEGGARRKGPFVAENCSALPPELMERELFGHVEGAFTGADRDRPGLLELASGGTLFLDEVGDMPPALQAKLLRALQEQAIRRVGGAELVRVDIRLLAATHKDLRAMVQRGEFREDLFFRLAAVELRVPPLRERQGDVAVLARFFLKRHDSQNGTQHQISEAALQQLARWPWPGNVRELEHVIARACLLGDSMEIEAAHLPIAPAMVQGADPGNEGQAAPATWPVITLLEAERRTVQAVLKFHGGDKAKSARTLGISRTALYEKLKRYEKE